LSFKTSKYASITPRYYHISVFSSKGSHSHPAFGLHSKAEVAHVFRGIWCMLTTDQKECRLGSKFMWSGTLWMCLCP